VKLIHFSSILDVKCQCLQVTFCVCTVNPLLMSYQNEKQKVEEQRDCLQQEVEQLSGELAVTHNEATKEEKKQKVCNV